MSQNTINKSTETFNQVLKAVMGSCPKAEHKTYKDWEGLRFDGHRLVVSKNNPNRVTVDVQISGKKGDEAQALLAQAGIPSSRVRKGGTGMLARILDFSMADWQIVAPLVGATESDLPEELEEGEGEQY